MALTDCTHKDDVSLNTDLYELTMAQGFWDSGLAAAQGCFSVFFRTYPFSGGYAIAAGIGQVASLVENFAFSEEHIDYLSQLKAPGGGALFKKAFLDYLKNFKMNVDIWAIPEGELAFSREPMLRVEGPLIDCQLLETALLNTVNFQTLLATKTARVVSAAQGHPIFEFGLRRAQGPDGGLTAARASFVGGAAATSNLLAGKVYDIPVFGTHAHSWVMAFDTQLEAFRAFARSMPNNCVLLLDTYDVHLGVRDAITVAREMEARGERLAGIRLDSGDLAKLSIMVRKAFDEAGLPYVKISASNDLDEYTIQSLYAQGAPIDSFGVGTKLATCDPQPALGGVYKLSAMRKDESLPWKPTIKVSEVSYKRTIPGVQQIMRCYNKAGSPVGDMIYDVNEGISDRSTMVDVLDNLITHDISASTGRDLLEHIVSHGRCIKDPDSLRQARARAQQALAALDPAIRRFLNPEVYPVGLETQLSALRSRLTTQELQINAQ